MKTLIPTNHCRPTRLNCGYQITFSNTPKRLELMAAPGRLAWIETVAVDCPRPGRAAKTASANKRQANTLIFIEGQ